MATVKPVYVTVGRAVIMSMGKLYPLHPKVFVAAVDLRVARSAADGSRRRNFSTTTSLPAAVPVSGRTTSLAKGSYRLVVLGGGSAGCAMANKFAAKFGKGQVAIVEPSETHYYQPMFTMVGAGMRSLEETHRPMASLLPKSCDWIQDAAVSIDPARNTVTTERGNTLKYDSLVVALGLQLNYNQIKNCVEALKTDPSVVSIYSADYVRKVHPAVQALKSGNAIFTFPNTGIKCAGAAQKICYLSEELVRNNGHRDNVEFVYNTAPPTIFSNPYYAAALEKLAVSRGVQWNKLKNLVEIRPEKKEAVFELMKDGKGTGQTEVLNYSVLHVVPPMSTPRLLWNSPLVDETNFVTVNPKTLQHVKYSNVFALGDCSNIPMPKTAAAIAAQIPVASRNLQYALDGKQPEKEYNGYTSCPLLVSRDKVMLAEFGYDEKILETFPVDQSKPRRSMYLVLNYMMPSIYWQLLVKPVAYLIDAARKLNNPHFVKATSAARGRLGLRRWRIMEVRPHFTPDVSFCYEVHAEQPI